MSRRTWIILGAVGAALLTLAALAVFVAPTLVRDSIEKRLRERLASRGIEATWSDFSSHHGQSFELDDVQLDAPRYGLSLHSGKVVVDVSLDTILSGDPKIEGISLEPVDVTVDVDAVLEQTDFHAADGARAGGDGGIIRRILENPPDVVLRDADVRLVRGDVGLVDAHSDSLTIRESWGSFEVAGAGDARLAVPDLPGFLVKAVPWRLSATIEPTEGTFAYTLAAPDEDAPLVHMSSPDVLMVRLNTITGTGSYSDRTVTFDMDDLALRVGAAPHPALDAKLPRLVFRVHGGRPGIRLVKPSLFATPAKLDALHDVAPWFRTLLAAISHRSAAKPRSGPRPGPRPNRTVRAIARVANQADVSVDALEMGVNVEDELGDFHRLTLLERLDAHADHGRVRAHARSAGGTFEAAADYAPGGFWPTYLVARAKDVHLDQIPGMPRKRSELPSRGTSGHLGGVVSGELFLSMPPLGRLGPLEQPPGFGKLSFSWHDGVVDLVGVSEEPLTGIDASAEATFRWRPELDDLEVTDATAEYGPVTVHGTGEIRDMTYDPEIVLRAQMEEIECEKSVRAIPSGLLGPLRHIELDGKWSPKMYFRLPIHHPRRLKLSFDEYEDLCTIEGLNIPGDDWPDIRIVDQAPTGPHRTAGRIPPDHDNSKLDDVFWLDRPFVKRVTEGVVDPETSEVWVGPGLPSYVPLEQMPRWVGPAAFLSEEMMFYTDPAISIGLIKKALRLNLEKGRFVYGGSTVTQQLVKNLFLTRRKTLARKLREALISWRITQVIPKDRILELYLNCIEFGPDVYGIGPAAKYYFQKDARQLSPKEAIFLAMLKPAPWYGRKVIDRNKTPSGGWWAGRMEELFQRLVDKGYLTKARAEAEKPYVLRWDDHGRYEDPNPPEPVVPKIPLFE